ncbi:hypothetical protein K4L06_22410 [Lysobacter sp. BMK333-48F3]|uniref:hypothetical protein n=1 Tax=Lysobacter sp. BMK333-48F3 TaxID=2867962 RepID=UPI001C8C7394|nr:hypothetical protein [Lysobacter sp. BMK333-48F3]MBX9404061.1 hypothetical protein [Lysobacter sp. BMK333-48F3]
MPTMHGRAGAARPLDCQGPIWHGHDSAVNFLDRSGISIKQKAFSPPFLLPRRNMERAMARQAPAQPGRPAHCVAPRSGLPRTRIRAAGADTRSRRLGALSETGPAMLSARSDPWRSPPIHAILRYSRYR